MKVGIKNQVKKTVSNALTAKAMGSGRLDVFATPAMVAMMEEAAHTSVEAELEEGNSRNVYDRVTPCSNSGRHGGYMRE